MRSLVLLIFGIVIISSAAHAGALHEAAKTGDVAAIEAALAAGVDVNAPEDKGLKATALYYAASKGHVAAVELLLAKGADVNLGSEMVSAPLINAASYKRVEILQLLLAHGADPNRQYKGNTALHQAAQTGCMDCVKALVEAGADVNAINAMREPAIHQALFNRHQDVADYLAAHGYVKPGVPPVSAALATANLEAGRKLFHKQCARCHDDTRQAKMGGAPPLWGIVGRLKASVAKFGYSAAMKAEGGVWGFEELNLFIADPSRTIPGLAMKTLGYQEPQQRADLIVYLRTLSDNPVPLPGQ